MYQAPVQIPRDIDALRRVLLEEFNKLQRSFIGEHDFVILKVLHVEPSRIYPGMLVIADGTNFNPSALGSGQGLYRRLEDNSAWEFIG